MHLGQRRHLHGIVDDEGRLDECTLTELAEQLVDELALTHGLVHIHLFRQAEGADLFLALALAVEARLLLDGLKDGKAAVGSLERNELSVDFALGLAVHGDTDGLKEFLRERHHPVVVLILNVEFHTSELWVVVAVHSLVAEVLAYLIDTFEATHDESLQVELSGDAHIHVLVEGIEVGDERTGRCTAGNGLQRRGLHFGITSLVEHTAHGADDGGALQESLLHTFVHHKVDIALAIAQLWVVELIVGHTVLVFHDGQGLQGLREQGQFLGMDADLTGLCTEHETAHADEVANVEQLLEHGVVKLFVLIGTDVITSDIHLDAAF